jgi:nitrite reductase (NO-forming)
VTRTAWHLRVGAVVAAWLLAAALSGLRGLVADVDPWLPVHLLLLGAVSNAILVWSSYFAEALLRLPGKADRRAEAARLVVFNAGALVVVAGMTGAWWGAVVVGATLAAGAAVWHGAVLLTRMHRSLPSRFGATVRYYVAASSVLPVGIALGVVMAHVDLDDEMHARVALGHVALNVLGWIGLTVLGTVVTLWPTMLHTQVADGAELAARRALPVLVAAVVVLAAGALAGLAAVAAAGLVGYAAGLVLSGRALAQEARRRPPRTYATLSVAAGYLWLTGSVLVLAVVVGSAGSWATAAGTADRLGAPLLVGFAAQVLLGALSYLVPVVLGGGPTAARATGAALDTAARTRVAVVNVGLVVLVGPVPDGVRTVAAAAVLLALASFLPLVLRAVVVARRLRTS